MPLWIEYLESRGFKVNHVLKLRSYGLPYPRPTCFGHIYMLQHQFEEAEAAGFAVSEAEAKRIDEENKDSHMEEIAAFEKMFGVILPPLQSR